MKRLLLPGTAVLREDQTAVPGKLCLPSLDELVMGTRGHATRTLRRSSPGLEAGVLVLIRLCISLWPLVASPAALRLLIPDVSSSSEDETSSGRTLHVPHCLVSPSHKDPDEDVPHTE